MVPAPIKTLIAGAYYLPTTVLATSSDVQTRVIAVTVAAVGVAISIGAIFFDQYRTNRSASLKSQIEKLTHERDTLVGVLEEHGLKSPL